MRSNWRATLASEFHYLGPFPTSAREQQYLSPAYPLNLNVHSSTLSIHDESNWYSSSIADDGRVRWTKGSVEHPGSYVISYPLVRWRQLRAVFGWAALQHHSLVHTILTITPSADSSLSGLSDPRLYFRLSLKQASFVSFVPRIQTSEEPSVAWYEGDIYAQSPHESIISLPAAHAIDGKLEYDVFISVDYEIRLFGDPQVNTADDIPISRIQFSVSLIESPGVYVGDTFVTPDIVAGKIWGNVIGVLIENSESWNTISSVHSEYDGIELTLEARSVRLAPFQTRLIPLNVKQHKDVHSSIQALPVTLTFASGYDVRLRIPLIHKDDWRSNHDSDLVIHQTHRVPILSDSFLLPPLHSGGSNTSMAPAKPILAVHGAGVDVAWKEWTSAIQRREHNWVILARGLTPWGYDWRGPSAQDALAALDAVQHREAHFGDGSPIAETTVVAGHSNGGQGAFYLASHFPDLFRGSIPISGYLSASSYVPSAPMSQGIHFVDPALRAILDASTSGGDNDIFLGNMSTRKSRVFHGGDDENVPVWNSRKAVDIIRSYDSFADVSFHEVPGKPHWWDGLFRMQSVEDALTKLLEHDTDDRSEDTSFTLTVLWPRESGSLRGCQILETKTPGRLAKLHVTGGSIRTVNVSAFSLSGHVWQKDLEIDGQHLPASEIIKNQTNNGTLIYYTLSESGQWKISDARLAQESGPLSRILSYGSPITLVVPESSQLEGYSNHLLDLALRMAHNLLSYLNIDCDIVTDSELLAASSQIPTEGIIVFGGPNVNRFALKQLSDSTFPINFIHTSGAFRIQNRNFDEQGIGLLFMKGGVLFIHGTDFAGYERAMRAFPLRTGVPNPEWVVLGPQVDKTSIGGILGAGFWDRAGQFSEIMSWIG